MNTKVVASLVLGAACSLSAVQAAQITLFNTGVNNASTVLANGTLGDPHYTLVAAPAGSTTTLRVLTSANGFPIGPWLGDNTSSAWIAPNNAADVSSPAGTYTYRTTFDLTGYNLHSGVRISGLWSTDNNGLDILLNGISQGFTTANEQFQVGGSWFGLSAGIIAGVNTIDFVVRNSEGPTGLRVEMSGYTVPEPGSLALAGLALLGMGLARRRAAR